MTKPEIGDQVKTRHGWRRITAFSEDSGTQLDDLHWVCASAFHLLAAARDGGVNIWEYDPAKAQKAGGWDWIEEGQRIKERARAVSGLTEEVMAESVVFNHQALDEESEDRGESWAVESENYRLRAEVRRLKAESRYQHCLAHARGQRIFELQGELAALREAQPKTVAALREALIHAGEGVQL
ncbi:hypothetical protein [Streptomyces parvus]|uniref:hypothetical protein n=1 Tax=Streptomyces parvus TaxID=66428 RepID=UPI003D71526C